MNIPPPFYRDIFVGYLAIMAHRRTATIACAEPLALLTLLSTVCSYILIDSSCVPRLSRYIPGTRRFLLGVNAILLVGSYIQSPFSAAFCRRSSCLRRMTYIMIFMPVIFHVICRSSEKQTSGAAWIVLRSRLHPRSQHWRLSKKNLQRELEVLNCHSNLC